MKVLMQKRRAPAGYPNELLAFFGPVQPPISSELLQDADLLQGTKLPRALELAQLAAALGPTDDMERSIKNAARLYLRSEAFCRRHEQDGLSSLANAADDTALHLAALFYPTHSPILLLEMDKRSDEARRHLKRKRLLLKTARSVKENLLRCAKHGQVLGFLSRHDKDSELNPNGLAFAQAEKLLERRARNAGWKDTSRDFLLSLKEKRRDNREVYLVPRRFLDALVAFKKALKHKGGVLSRQRGG